LGDVDNSLGKSLGRFLRQVVPDAALDQPVLVFAAELRVKLRNARSASGGLATCPR
jgi:hypothetical protein